MESLLGNPALQDNTDITAKLKYSEGQVAQKQRELATAAPTTPDRTIQGYIYFPKNILLYVQEEVTHFM